LNRPKHGGNLTWAATAAGCTPSQLLDFSSSINPLGPPDSVLTALRENLSAIVAYPDPNYPELAKAIADRHQLAPDWVLPGNGAAELLNWAAWELSRLDSTFLIEPAFSDYQRSLTTFGAKILHRSLITEDGRLASLDYALRYLPSSVPVPLGLIINNPHNPTGQVWSAAEIAAYLDRFSLVIVDESFMDFVPQGRQQSLIPLLSKYRNLAIVRSLTKFYSLPGLRLGYCLSHPDRILKWKQWRDPWPVNTLAAIAGIAALQTDREFEEWTWEWLATEGARLYSALSEIDGLEPYPSAVNFLLVKTQTPGTKLQTQLLKHDRILIRDCLSFPELGDRYFRVAVKDRASNDRLLSALSKPPESN
jgi:L-threonine-O-3-phosphate decarboxylase